MIIKLCPQRGDEPYNVVKDGNTLTINGVLFDFSRMKPGDTLPGEAVESMWFKPGPVEMIDSELVVTLRFPFPANFSQEQMFPRDLIAVPDGKVAFPEPLPGGEPVVVDDTSTPSVGQIDWSQLITAEMKAAEAQAERLAESKAQLAARNATAAAQIDRITDRIETLGYGIEAGEATPEDAAEQAALAVNLKTWKAYKFALGKVTAQTTWPTAPAWPVEPAIPEIAAAPMLAAEESE
ncbi:hypothetical protein PchlO6_2175 [Pseudomonas chlororaphis O6]|uniref:Tail fiber assembly protein n=2 Tax=Pseudomonas chlororaphis TaxID=587753 RepID=A0AB33WMU6_9PSED|nr:hypothetical protein PchlO6_2175 [Pseudomonas chlororaphis O6]